MSDKAAVFALRAAHPEWTSGQIAKALNCDAAYVRATARRGGVAFGMAIGATGRSIDDLGRTARALGFTVATLRRFAERAAGKGKTS